LCGLCFEGDNKKDPGDLVGGFSDLEMTWLLYCAGVSTTLPKNSITVYISQQDALSIKGRPSGNAFLLL